MVEAVSGSSDETVVRRKNWASRGTDPGAVGVESYRDPAPGFRSCSECQVYRPGVEDGWGNNHGLQRDRDCSKPDR